MSAQAALAAASKSPSKMITRNKRKPTTPAISANSLLETAAVLMFPEAVRQHGLSLLPPSQFTQKKVGVVAWAADVVHDDGAAHFTGVVDDDVAKAH